MTSELTPYNGYRYLLQKGRSATDDREKNQAGRDMLMHADALPKRGNVLNAQQPKGVLITFDEANQSFNICTVPRASVDDLMNRALVVPWALADSNFKLDDEVARSIGGLVFRLLATAQPELTPLITVTDHPDANNPPPSA